MRILLVSSNTLFKEVLGDTFLKRITADLVQINPDAARAEIAAFLPEFILVDESGMNSDEMSEILEATRGLRKSCTILLSLQNNNMVVLNAHRTTIRNAEDLLDTIRVAEEHCGTDRTVEAGARAEAYGVLAALCSRRPDLSLVRRLRALGVENFVNLIHAEQSGAETQSGVQQISAFIQDTAYQSDEQVEQALAVDWTRLFRGLRPGYGPPPPYEGVYREGDNLKTMRMVAHYYRKHGVEPAENAGNRPDYLGLELDFLRYVCEQQAGALEQGDPEEMERWRYAEQYFLENHIGKWIEAYCERAIAEAQTDFYRGTLQLMCKMIVDDYGNATA